MDGTLSGSEFHAAACAFAERWAKLNLSLPQWSWLPSPKRPWISHQNHLVGYLSLEKVVLPRLSEESQKEECVSADKEESVSQYEDDDDDDALDSAAVVVHNGGSGVHRYDFHAVYSATYRVPVLYFRAYCNDGQPLHLDEIEKDIPVNSAQLLAKSKWTFMTQEEHPELGRPWFTLHPCGTSEWMKLLLSSTTTCGSRVYQGSECVEQYMISWFSVVGQVFGLKLSSEMMNFDGLGCL